MSHFTSTFALLATGVLCWIIPQSTEPAPSESKQQSDEPLISSSYRTFAESEIKRIFRGAVHRAPSDDEMSEAIALFEARVRSLPADIARELGEREHRNLEARADLETGGALAFLANISGGGAGPFEDLVATNEALAILFPPIQAASEVRVASASELVSSAREGATVRFPVGVFELGNVLAAIEAFPRGVSIAGAGIEQTLLVVSEPLAARTRLENLRIANCTVLVRGNRLFRQTHTATIRLDSVRVLGFDNGAGEGALFESSAGLALSARNCSFLGGFGRVPGGGSLFAVPRAALIARFEDCNFELCSVGLARLVRGVTLRFERCSLTNIVDDPQRDSSDWRGVRFVESPLTRLDPKSRPTTQRTLEAWFPNWSSRVVR